MDLATAGIILSVLSGAASVVWLASRVKTTVDIHGNAIGELKRRLDAHDRAITDHHGRLSRLEGKS